MRPSFHPPLLWCLCLLVVLVACRNESENNVSVTFRVNSTLSDPYQTVFITGNLAKLGMWDPNQVPMQQISDSIWILTVQVPSGKKLAYKYTLGEWQNEALQENDLEYPNFELTAYRDTTVSIRIHKWARPSGLLVISEERLRNKSGHLEAYLPWRFRKGDNPNWAYPAYNDSSWQLVETFFRSLEFPKIDWEGIGWFRLNLNVDSSMFGKPLAVRMVQAGASEIFLNGKLIKTFGTVALSPEAETRYFDRTPFIIELDSTTSQLLAVRFSNHNAQYFSEKQWMSGFFMLLGDPNTLVAQRSSQIRFISVYQILFTILPLTLAFIHFLLFAFYPTIRGNIFYALCLVGFAGITFGNYQGLFENDFESLIFYNQLYFVSLSTALMFGLFTLYSRISDKLPKIAWFFAATGLMFSLWYMFWPRYFSFDVAYGLMALVGLEMIRQIYLLLKQKKVWSWFNAFGILILILAIVWQELIDNNIMAPPQQSPIVYVYGLMALAFTMSFNLAREIALDRRRLIDQESEAREKELERRLLALDNRRKTAELEEARQIQLSLLPEDLPELTHFEVAVHMQTATEVGGDYYDFIVQDEEQFLAVVGDATGHGMRAGIMVTLMKSMIHEAGNIFFLPDFFQKCTRVIKSMKLKTLFMGLTLMRFKGQKFTVSAAGMPPVLLYRSKDKTVEEIILKGLPLGGPFFNGYKEVKGVLEPGDIILLRSDGLEEAFNEQREEMGEDVLKEVLKEKNQQSPADIIRALLEKGEKWRGQQDFHDDITLMVLKCR